jgi:hypothetical protein
MEQQLLQLLAETQSPAEGLRKHAESQLEQLYTNEAFPISLAHSVTQLRPSQPPTGSPTGPQNIRACRMVPTI